MATRRFHRRRKVRLHDSGLWVCTIGRRFSPKKNKLVDADWYFGGAQAEAVDRANSRARQWELLCKNWDRTERPFLEILGEPLPQEPRWPAAHSPDTKTKKLTAEALQSLRREGKVDDEELDEAYAEFTFAELIPVYEYDRADDLKNKQVQHTSLSKDVSQMRQAARFLPSNIAAVELSASHFRAAKTKMLETLGRRTASNYLSAAVKLLTWVYGRHGGSEKRLPVGIDEAILVRKSKNTKITVHGTDELEALAGRVAGTLAEVDMLLALNCGMYQADIGRLLLAELDLSEGSAFWDREKEPDNEFRIHHVFWPETLAVVKRWLNDGKVDREFLDHRHGEEHSEVVTTRDLAFLDKGRPRYLVKPSGSAYDLVGRAWTGMETGVQFHNLRKSANDSLVKLINRSHDGGTDALQGVQEISNRFLGQKSETLVRLYRTHGKAVYHRMNKYLGKLGDDLRATGVFRPFGV